MAVNQFTSPDTKASHVQLQAPGDGSPVQITDATLLFKGDYSRSGNDLEISGSDGKSVTIEGYFHTGSASALVGPNGAMLSGDVVEALAGPLFPGQYAQSGNAGQAGNPIGEVQHLEGTAVATRTDGSVVQLTPGTKVYLGDVVETGPNTKFGLSLEDGSLFSMTSDARMVLNEFVFNGDQAQDSSMLVNLVQGAFVFVAGSIAPTGNMKVETPVAVLAIRGTTVGAEVDSQLGSTELSLFQDVDSNKTGEYLVLDKSTGEIIGRVTEVGNKLIITGVGETPIIVQKTDQDLLSDLSALELIRAVYAKASGQQGEFESESGSGSFLDIQLVSLSSSFTIEELAGNPLAQASAQKIVFDTPDQDDPPVAFFDGFFTDEDDIFAGNVISNTSIQPDEDPEGFDVRVVGFGEDLIWEEGVDFDFVGGIISPTGSTTFVLSSGAVVEISANGDFTYNPNPAFDYLADGESAIDSFSYLIADPGNSTDSDTVEVTVFGSNDRPVVISAQASHQDSIVENPDVQDSATIRTASGIVEFSDVDSTDNHDNQTTDTPVFVSAVWDRNGALTDLDVEQLGSVDLDLTYTVAPSPTPSPGTGPVTGQIAWQFSVADQEIDFLAAGETLTLTYRVNVTDDSGVSDTNTASQLITITVIGTNDVPLVAVGDVTGGVTELVTPVGDLTDTGTITFTDVDLTDTHSIGDEIVASDGALGSLTASVTADTTGTGTGGVITWEYTVAASAVEYLAEGQTKVETFTIELDDGNGGIVERTISVTVTGTNDVPLVAAEDVIGGVTELVTPVGDLTDTGTITFTDVDLTDTHSIGDEIVASDGALGSLTASVTADTTGTGTGGVITWEYTVAASAVEYLAEGQTKVETFTIELDDGNGGIVERTISVTVTGTNDVPLVAVGDVTGGVTELVTPVGDLTDTGTITFTDVDLTDTHGIGDEIVASDGALGSLTASVTADTTGTGTGGVITWEYTVAASAVEYLAEGQTKVETFTIELDDGNGGIVERTISVTVTGTNDVPEISAAEVNGTGLVEAGFGVAGVGEVFGDVSGDWSDADQGEAALLAVSQGSAGAAAQSVLAFDGGTGEAEIVGTYGSLFIKADGTYRYVLDDADADTQALTDGETVTDSFNYTINNGTDAGDTATSGISVDITGSNDAPLISAAESASGIIEAGSGVTGVSEIIGNVSGEWSDADQGEQALLKVVGGSAGVAPQLVLVFEGGTGDEAEITGTYGSLFIKQDGSYRYVLDNADEDTQALTDGQSVTDSFNYTIANGEDPGDTATSTIDVDITGSDDGPNLNIVSLDDFEFSNVNLVPDEVYQTAENGEDLFSFQDGALTNSPPFILTDFVPTDDVLDLSTLLENTDYTPGESAIEDWVQLVDDGTDTTVRFDADGPGTEADYVDLAVLDGVTGAAGIKVVDTTDGFTGT